MRRSGVWFWREMHSKSPRNPWDAVQFLERLFRDVHGMLPCGLQQEHWLPGFSGSFPAHWRAYLSTWSWNYGQLSGEFFQDLRIFGLRYSSRHRKRSAKGTNWAWVDMVRWSGESADASYQYTLDMGCIVHWSPMDLGHQNFMAWYVQFLPCREGGALLWLMKSCQVTSLIAYNCFDGIIFSRFSRPPAMAKRWYARTAWCFSQRMGWKVAFWVLIFLM